MAGKIIILPRDRLAWHRQMVEDRGLSDMAFRVGVIIEIHFNNRTGRTFVGYDGIAERIGVERTSVWRAIRALRDRGHLEVLSGGGRNVANEYRMILKTVAPLQRFNAAETVASRVENSCRIATTTLPAPTEQDSTQHFVGEDSADAAQWARYLRQRKQIVPFAITLPDGRRGFWMPSPRPPTETERSSSAEPKRSGDEETFDRFRDRLARIKLEKKHG
jgi:biotin operon repressor